MIKKTISDYRKLRIRWRCYECGDWWDDYLSESYCLLGESGYPTFKEEDFICKKCYENLRSEEEIKIIEETYGDMGYCFSCLKCNGTFEHWENKPYRIPRQKMSVEMEEEESFFIKEQPFFTVCENCCKKYYIDEFEKGEN